MQLQLPPKAPKTHRQHTEQSCRICFKRNGTKKHLQGLMEFESLKQDSAMWPSAHSVRPDWPRVGGKRAEMVWLPLKKGRCPGLAQWHHWYLMLGMTQELSYKVKMCQFPSGLGFCNGLAQEKESIDRRCLIPWIQEYLYHCTHECPEFLQCVTCCNDTQSFLRTSFFLNVILKSDPRQDGRRISWWHEIWCRAGRLWHKNSQRCTNHSVVIHH